ncbi:MAG: TVP38/TMEM64 family protein [Gammaproteobacteria bacterium]
MKKTTLLRWCIFTVLIALIVFVAIKYRDQVNIAYLQSLLEQYGVWAPLIFIGIYSLGVVLFLPGSVLTIAGGLIFGPYLGTLYNICSAIIGSTIAFLIARYLASDWVTHKTGGKLKQLKEGVEKEGWRFIAVVRLIPLFPFNLLNYALGLTQVKLSAYIIASAIFMLPATFAYTYLGSLGQAAVRGKPAEIITKVFIAIGLLVIVAIIPWIVKKLRQDNNKGNSND